MLTHPERIRVVCFDAVGTVIYPRPEAAAVYAEVGRRHGCALEPVEIERRFHAAFRQEEEIDARASHRTSEVRERQRWHAIVTRVFRDLAEPERPFQELWEHFAEPRAWACYTDVAPCWAWLKARGLRLAIASNYDDRLRRVVQGLPELRACEGLAISSVIGWRKPSPEFFAGLLERCGGAPDEVLFVGDDVEYDFVGGRRAGLQVVLLDRQRRHAGLVPISTLSELSGLLAARS